MPRPAAPTLASRPARPGAPATWTRRLNTATDDHEVEEAPSPPSRRRRRLVPVADLGPRRNGSSARSGSGAPTERVRDSGPARRPAAAAAPTRPTRPPRPAEPSVEIELPRRAAPVADEVEQPRREAPTPAPASAPAPVPTRPPEPHANTDAPPDLTVHSAILAKRAIASLHTPPPPSMHAALLGAHHEAGVPDRFDRGWTPPPPSSPKLIDRHYVPEDLAHLPDMESDVLSAHDLPVSRHRRALRAVAASFMWVGGEVEVPVALGSDVEAEVVDRGRRRVREASTQRASTGKRKRRIRDESDYDYEDENDEKENRPPFASRPRRGPSPATSPFPATRARNSRRTARTAWAPPRPATPRRATPASTAQPAIVSRASAPAVAPAPALTAAAVPRKRVPLGEIILQRNAQALRTLPRPLSPSSTPDEVWADISTSTAVPQPTERRPAAGGGLAARALGRDAVALSDATQSAPAEMAADRRQLAMARTAAESRSRRAAVVGTGPAERGAPRRT
ncbi:hypothetical protein GGF31_002496 [Allomyces arbusculus]|nr:hypothetical protein GGF31_002496 [Allomyces arbusculus]